MISSSSSTIADLLQAVDQADSSEALFVAVRSLAARQDEAAIPTLIRVLGYNNPGAAVAAVEGLIALGYAASSALLETVDGYNYGARAWTLRALAGIGDPKALELLVEAAESDFSLSVRRAAARGLGTIRWQDVSEGDRPLVKARCLTSLRRVCADPEWVVRYAAVSGLDLLAAVLEEPSPRTEIREQLGALVSEDPELAVRARATLALSRLA
jgi:phycocyanobilin lyase beta subunit